MRVLRDGSHNSMKNIPKITCREFQMPQCSVFTARLLEAVFKVQPDSKLTESCDSKFEA